MADYNVSCGLSGTIIEGGDEVYIIPVAKPKQYDDEFTKQYYRSNYAMLASPMLATFDTRGEVTNIRFKYQIEKDILEKHYGMSVENFIQILVEESSNDIGDDYNKILDKLNIDYLECGIMYIHKDLVHGIFNVGELTHFPEVKDDTYDNLNMMQYSYLAHHYAWGYRCIGINQDPNIFTKSIFTDEEFRKNNSVKDLSFTTKKVVSFYEIENEKDFNFFQEAYNLKHKGILPSYVLASVAYCKEMDKKIKDFTYLLKTFYRNVKPFVYTKDLKLSYGDPIKYKEISEKIEIINNQKIKNKKSYE